MVNISQNSELAKQSYASQLLFEDVFAAFHGKVGCRLQMTTLHDFTISALTHGALPLPCAVVGYFKIFVELAKV